MPRVRSGSFSTELFARYQRSERALCGTEFSKSTVSSLCQGLDETVKEWNNRDFKIQEYPFLFVDALAIRVRKGGRVRPSHVLLATGINHEGDREILGFFLGESEPMEG